MHFFLKNQPPFFKTNLTFNVVYLDCLYENELKFTYCFENVYIMKLIFNYKILTYKSIHS